jgi:MFS family permease
VTAAVATPRDGRVITTQIPARLDRLPWSRFHWRIVIGLGTVWVLDGLEVTIVGSIAPRLTEAGSGIHLNAAQIGTAAALYVAGACAGALLFGQLTDRHGRKRLFMVTLLLYLLATVATSFATEAWYFFLCRFLTGAGIGGEYAAINSAIDELIPARNRGRVDLAINGSYWVGAAIGAFAALLLLNTSLFSRDLGWRLAFAAGAIIGLGILFVRRHVPESPRWLFIHGREEEAERIVVQIEADVAADTGQPLPEARDSIRVRQREAIPFRELARVAFTRYPRRAVLGLALFIGQAFLYNAVTFDLGTILSQFFNVSSSSVPYFMAVFAVSNFMGPLMLGRLFDTVGRIPMISGTYLVSAALVATLGVLLLTDSLSTWAFMGLVLATFFFASAGASSAYLTVSEVFPMETRALAIALFFAIGTATGGIVGPELFGQFVHSGNQDLVALGFFIGAGAMALGGIAELFLGVRAEQQSLENIATPLTAEEADALLPVSLDGAGPPKPQVYQELREAVRYRERAEAERASADEHRALLHELLPRAEVGDSEAADRIRTEEVLVQIAELHAQSFDELAAAHDERAQAAQAGSEAERRAALERAGAAEERARAYEERATALAAEHSPDAGEHNLMAEAASERARAKEQRALAEHARGEAQQVEGPHAELARARADMHEQWAAMHEARAAALEATAHRNAEEATRWEGEAHALEQRAMAAAQRVEAAEHRARMYELQSQEVALSLTEREERIRERATRRLAREREGMRRFRPGPGSFFYSPAMVGTAGTASRLAAVADEDLDREVEVLARALEERGPTEREELERLVGARFWGPGRFREAVRTALEEGRIKQLSRNTYAPARPDNGRWTRGEPGRERADAVGAQRDA